MSYETKQLLSNINDEIEALKIEDGLINAGGAALNTALGELGVALGTSITNANTALSVAVGDIHSLISDIHSLISGETTRATAAEVLLQSNLDAIVSPNYSFNVSSSNNTYINLNTGDILPFNLIKLCVPDVLAYVDYKYIVQSDGVYSFGISLYIQSSSTTIFEVGIYKNSQLIALGGRQAGQSECISTLEQCVIGDYVDIRCGRGTNVSVYMGYPHTQFFGHRVGI